MKLEKTSKNDLNEGKKTDFLRDHPFIDTVHDPNLIEEYRSLCDKIYTSNDNNDSIALAFDFLNNRQEENPVLCSLETRKRINDAINQTKFLIRREIIKKYKFSPPVINERDDLSECDIKYNKFLQNGEKILVEFEDVFFDEELRSIVKEGAEKSSIETKDDFNNAIQKIKSSYEKPKVREWDNISNEVCPFEFRNEYITTSLKEVLDILKVPAYISRLEEHGNPRDGMTIKKLKEYQNLKLEKFSILHIKPKGLNIKDKLRFMKEHILPFYMMKYLSSNIEDDELENNEIFLSFIENYLNKDLSAKNHMTQWLGFDEFKDAQSPTTKDSEDLEFAAAVEEIDGIDEMSNQEAIVFMKERSSALALEIERYLKDENNIIEITDKIKETALFNRVRKNYESSFNNVKKALDKFVVLIENLNIKYNIPLEIEDIFTKYNNFEYFIYDLEFGENISRFFQILDNSQNGDSAKALNEMTKHIEDEKSEEIEKLKISLLKKMDELTLLVKYDKEASFTDDDTQKVKNTLYSMNKDGQRYFMLIFKYLTENREMLHITNSNSKKKYNERNNFYNDIEKLLQDFYDENINREDLSILNDSLASEGHSLKGKNSILRKKLYGIEEELEKLLNTRKDVFKCAGGYSVNKSETIVNIHNIDEQDNPVSFVIKKIFKLLHFNRDNNLIPSRDHIIKSLVPDLKKIIGERLQINDIDVLEVAKEYLKENRNNKKE